MCIQDWYGTFSELAGIDPTDWRAKAAHLPAVDSHSMVPVILGTGSSTRLEVPISHDMSGANEVALIPRIAAARLIKRDAKGEDSLILTGFCD
eukprot:COSAG02_NODE_981_length_15488_cov_27.585093_9_plen_93_part_00